MRDYPEGGRAAAGISHHRTVDSGGGEHSRARTWLAASTVAKQVMRGTAFGRYVKGKERAQQQDLLSDEVWVVGCLHFEGAILSPQVDRIGDASDASFVDLGAPLAIHPAGLRMSGHSGKGGGGRRTISADSGPAILNSMSAYFFQYPNRRGNLSRKRS